MRPSIYAAPCGRRALRVDWLRFFIPLAITEGVKLYGNGRTTRGGVEAGGCDYEASARTRARGQAGLEPPGKVDDARPPRGPRRGVAEPARPAPQLGRAGLRVGAV